MVPSRNAVEISFLIRGTRPRSEIETHRPNGPLSWAIRAMLSGRMPGRLSIAMLLIEMPSSSVNAPIVSMRPIMEDLPNFRSAKQAFRRSRLRVCSSWCKGIPSETSNSFRNARMVSFQRIHSSAAMRMLVSTRKRDEPGRSPSSPLSSKYIKSMADAVVGGAAGRNSRSLAFTTWCRSPVRSRVVCRSLRITPIRPLATASAAAILRLPP